MAWGADWGPVGWMPHPGVGDHDVGGHGVGVDAASRVKSMKEGAGGGYSQK